MATIQLLVGPTQTYTKIMDAYATIPIFTSDDYEIIVDTGLYTENFQLTKKVHIKAAIGSEHNFILGTGVRIRGTTPFDEIHVLADHTKLTNLILEHSSTNGAVIDTVQNSGAFAQSCTFTNIIVTNALNALGAGGLYGVSGNNHTLINCVALNNNTNSFALIGFVLSGTNTTCYNCAAIKCNTGYFNLNGAIATLIRNCYSNASVGFNITGAISASCSNNASSDSTAPGSNSLTGLSQANFGFVNSGLSNYHILNSSRLFAAGVNLSSIFTTDIDNLPIFDWCIGPDSASRDTYQPTSSKPAEKNQNNQTNETEAQAPTLNLQGPSSAANFANSLGQNKEASVPGLNTSGNTGPVSIADIQAQKGYKNGFVSIMPEYGGYGAAGSVGTGNMVYLVEDRLITGKKFKDKAQITPSRAFNERATMAIDPQGQFTHEFRSNDSIALLQSHFQNRIGTTPATGTTYYEFTPHRAGLTLQGSTFGTGSYSAFNVSNAFTVSIYKALRGTGYHYKSGICNSLKFSFDPSDTVNVESDFRFATFSIIGTSGIPTGAYSGLSSFPGHKCNINFMGLPLLGFDFTCTNNLSKFSPVGTKTNFYKFGAYTVSGNADIDLPNDALRYIGSMIGGSVFSIDGTMLNDARDMVVFQMPTCVLDPFEIGVGMNLAKLSFKAYESEDASTPAITFKVWTQNYSATTFEPN